MREDVIYLTLYLATEMLSYLLAYWILFQTKVTKDKKRLLIGTVSLYLIHFFIFITNSRYVSKAMSPITMIILPIFMLEKREKKNFIIYPFIVIGTGNIMVSFTFLCAALFRVSESQVRENYIVLLCQCMPSIMMLILEGYRKYKKKSLIQIQLGRQQYILFYVGIFCTYLMLSAFQVLSKGRISDNVINLYGLAISVTCIAFIILILWQGIVVHREIQYKERCEMNERYLELQAEHFQQLMEQDEKMRKFRHDMNSHMNMLQFYCENEMYGDLKNYLAKFREESAVNNVKAYTGNRSVDAVIAPLAQEALEKNIVMKWKGMLPNETKVGLFDMCTILSNLLKNAIEACEKIPEGQERRIEAKVGTYYEQVYLEMRNTVAEEVVIDGDRLVTSKKDKKNHGIGSQNVAEAVEKYDGIIQYISEDGWFEVDIGI